ncbi:MAG: PAS domain S-box protein, partial [Polyangiaceae bacterium]
MTLEADLLANCAEAMVATDQHFVITYWNSAAEELFGWSVDEVLGQPSVTVFRTIVATSSREAAISSMLAHGGYRGEVSYFHKDGHRILAEVRCAVLRTDAGEFRGTVTGFRDITARKHAEDALRQSEARLHAILKQAPLGIGVVDQQGEVLVCNERWERMLPPRLPSRDRERARQWQAWAEDGRVLEPDEYPGSRALRGETVSPGIDFRYYRPDGIEVWIRVTSSPLQNDRGEVEGAIVLMEEITKQKRAEQALRVSEVRYRTLFDIIDEAVCLFERLPLLPNGNRDYRYIAMNPAMQAMFGIPDLSGQSIREHFP